MDATLDVLINDLEDETATAALEGVLQGGLLQGGAARTSTDENVAAGAIGAAGQQRGLTRGRSPTPSERGATPLQPFPNGAHSGDADVLRVHAPARERSPRASQRSPVPEPSKQVRKLESSLEAATARIRILERDMRQNSGLQKEVDALKTELVASGELVNKLKARVSYVPSCLFCRHSCHCSSTCHIHTSMFRLMSTGHTAALRIRVFSA
jgi:phage tail tape-measure protein